MERLNWKAIKYNNGSNIIFEMFQTNEEYNKRIVMLLQSGRNVEIIKHKENVNCKNVEETLKE